MVSEWRTVRLGDYADVQTGPFGSQLHKKDYVDIGTPIITVEHLGDNRIIHSDLPRVSGKDRLRLSKYWMQRGDIIFSRVESVDRSAYVHTEEDGWLFSGRCLRVRVNGANLDSRFLSFYFGLESVKEHMRQIAVGATMPSLNTALLSNIKIIVPPLSDQRVIAHIHGSLDNKIELNRRMNRALEATARAIFKSWFVDFYPVRAKAEGRPTGLPDDIAVIFPDSFEDSEIGEIPKGWEVFPLSEFLNIIGGGTPKTRVEEYWGGDIPWFSVVDAPSETDVFVIDTEKHVTQLGVNKSSTKVLRKGTTIISAQGTVGKCALVGCPMAMNQSCYGIQGKNGESDYFVYFTIRRQVSDLQRSGHGSVFNTITRDTFKTIRIALPQTKLTTSYEEIVHPLMELVLSNLFENVTLASLRDTLLPKLISGELRLPATAIDELAVQAGVPDAEKLAREPGV